MFDETFGGVQPDAGLCAAELEWVRQHMTEIVDIADYVVDVDGGGVALLCFGKLASEIDITPPVIEDPKPWVWDTVPPLSVLVREIAEKLHPGGDVTGWLYTQQQFADYAAQQESAGSESGEPDHV